MAAPGSPAYRDFKRQGNELLDAGKLDEAAQMYASALQVGGELPEAHVNLGYVLQELGRGAEAKAQFERALALDPHNFDAHLLLATLALGDRHMDVALAAIQSAMAVQPESVEARTFFFRLCALRGELAHIESFVRHKAAADTSEAGVQAEVARALANVAVENPLKDQLTELALEHLRQAIALDPAMTPAHIDFGMLMMTKNDYEAAATSFETAARLGSEDGHYFLGLVHKTVGRLELARDCMEASLKLKPDSTRVLNTLGQIHVQMGTVNSALVAYQKSMEIDPKARDTRGQLINLYILVGMYDKAEQLAKELVEAYPLDHEMFFLSANVFYAQSKYPKTLESLRKALSLKPSFTNAKLNMGSALIGTGDLQGAIALWREVAEAEPGNVLAWTDVTYGSSFDPSCSPATYLAYAKQYGAAAAALAKPFDSWKQAPLADRPLKVGLVSGDFCLHPAGYFLEGILSQLDNDKLELHAFSNRVTDDELQRSIKQRVASWTSIVGLSDQLAAQAIHEAELDLLIDLAGHTAFSRLGLLAWRPAPVQATWLGYWASTGLAEVDYILTDRYSVPEAHRANFSERPWYLPDTRLCFTPPTTLYEHTPQPPPAQRNGYCTFGSYQPIRKFTDAVFRTWGRIFAQLPDARLRLQGTNFTEPDIRAGLLQRLAAAGISPERVQLFPNAPRLDYLKSHAEVDVLLDTFPYPGGTTSCDALWMGVPTVTLAGQTMLSRQGVAMMCCAGLSDWVAQDEDEYVAIAVAKARDLTQLGRLRAGLRQQVFASPLFNAPLFARNLEASLWSMVMDKLGQGLDAPAQAQSA